MKELRMKVIETNTDDKLKAFAIAKRKDTVKATDFVKVPFRCDYYVITENTITDTETGEVSTMNCITFLGSSDGTDVCIGTNSKSVIKDFKEILDLLKDMEQEINSVQLMINQGKSRNGNTFNGIEIVL